jgi:hypothetical protein
VLKQSNGTTHSKSPLKNPLLYSSVLVGIVLVVVAWILFSRWQQNRSIEHRNRDEVSRKQRENDRITLRQLGGKDLAIQTFSVTPSVIRRGENAQLCYGVANAKKVALEPQPNAVWPSYSYCVDVSPAKTTTYTLTISDDTGNTKSQSLQLRVE